MFQLSGYFVAALRPPFSVYPSLCPPSRIINTVSIHHVPMLPLLPSPCFVSQEMRTRRGHAPYGHTQQLDLTWPPGAEAALTKVWVEGTQLT